MIINYELIDEYEGQIEELENKLKKIKEEIKALQHYKDTTVGLLATDRPEIFYETLKLLKEIGLDRSAKNLKEVFFNLSYDEQPEDLTKKPNLKLDFTRKK